MDNAGIAIGGEIERPAIDHQGLFQLGKQDFAPHRRPGGRYQQAMIAARVQARNGGRGKAAQAVGFEPLTAQRGLQIAAGFLVELNHGAPPRHASA